MRLHTDDEEVVKVKRFTSKKIPLFIAIVIVTLGVIGIIFYTKNLCGDTYENLMHFEENGIQRIDGYIYNWEVNSCFESIDYLSVDTKGYLIFEVHYKTYPLITHIIFEPYLDDNLYTISSKELYFDIIMPYIEQGIYFKK